MTLVVILCALPIGLIIGLSGAPDTLILAVFLAALPVGPLVACYMWLDRYEPEPRSLLALGLAWGAFVATAAALLLQGLGGFAGTLTSEQQLRFVAPATEEFTKGAFLLLLLWWRRHELDGVLDGIVYAGMVGIGFAFTENILYLAAAYNGTEGIAPGGAEALTGTFLVRCIASPFAHPLFTAFTGIGGGIAVSTRNPVTRFAAPLAGYAAAVVAHSAVEHGRSRWRRQLRQRLRDVDGPLLRRRDRVRRLAPPIRAHDAHSGALRCGLAGADSGHGHRVGGRSERSACRA